MTRLSTSRTLFFYLFRHLGFHVIIVLGCLSLLVAMIDTVELFRRASGYDKLDAGWVFSMALIKMPSTLPLLIPFGVLFGAVLSFQKLRNSNEIIIARSSGLSLLQCLTGPLSFAVVLAGFSLAVLDPVASATANRYTMLEEAAFGRVGRVLTVSTEGLWLRDNNQGDTVILHGQNYNAESGEMAAAQVFQFEANSRQQTVYKPERLLLRDGYWQLEGGMMIAYNGIVTPLAEKRINSVLRPADLMHSNKKPETVPLLDLLPFIAVLEKAGLPSFGYWSYFFYLTSTPLVFIGLVMMAAGFCLANTGRTQRSRLIINALATGFIFYFAKDLMYVLGTSGRLPALIAGWTPGVLAISFGMILLLKAEER